MDRRTFFVAHAYADRTSLDALLKAGLPEGGSPAIMPSASSEDDGLLSEVIMPSIRSSHGLVYLRSKRSLDSFWVAFERNYALRLRKPVYAFDPRTRGFEKETLPAIDPVLAISWNLCVPRDSFMIRRIAFHLHDQHQFEIRGQNWKLIDNDFRQMVDSVSALKTKIARGSLVVLFLSNDGICCGGHDYADPYEERRAWKDAETPVGLAGEKFALFPRDRTLNVWLDMPDRARIEAALAGFAEAHWRPYVEHLRAALDEENKCVVVKRSLSDAAAVGHPSLGSQQAFERVQAEMQPRPMDDILVRALHLAYRFSADFRLRLSSGLAG